MPSIIEGYELKDVFNADETGLFFRGLPERSLVVKKGERKGGKKAKERITLLLCCSATGEKLEPLILGKSANPRCFRGINVRTLNIRCSHVTQELYKPSRPIIAFNLSIIFYGISMNAHPLQNWPSQSRS